MNISKIVLNIIFLSSAIFSHSTIVIDGIKNISDNNKLCDDRLDANGLVPVELRLPTCETNIKMLGNVLGEPIKFPDHISFFVTGGTKQIRLTSFSDGSTDVFFRDFNIPYVKCGEIYEIIYHLDRVECTSRYDEAKLLFESGLPQMVWEKYLDVQDITSEEYFLLTECLVNMGWNTGDERNKAFYDYLKKAADAGHAEAQRKLAYHYLNGFDILLFDIDKAIEYYEKAANQGYVDAILEMTYWIYLDDMYNHVDFAKANYWAERILQLEQQNEVPDIYALGAAYAIIGYVNEIKGKMSEAVKYYNLAIEMKDDFDLAHSRLGMIYAKGNGVKKNIDRAIELLEIGRRYDDASQTLYDELVNNTSK